MTRGDKNKYRIGYYGRCITENANVLESAPLRVWQAVCAANQRHQPQQGNRCRKHKEDGVSQADTNTVPGGVSLPETFDTRTR